MGGGRRVSVRWAGEVEEGLPDGLEKKSKCEKESDDKRRQEDGKELIGS